MDQYVIVLNEWIPEQEKYQDFLNQDGYADVDVNLNEKPKIQMHVVWQENDNETIY